MLGLSQFVYTFVYCVIFSEYLQLSTLLSEEYLEKCLCGWWGHTCAWHPPPSMPVLCSASCQWFVPRKLSMIQRWIIYNPPFVSYIRHTQRHTHFLDTSVDMFLFYFQTHISSPMWCIHSLGMHHITILYCYVVHTQTVIVICKTFTTSCKLYKCTTNNKEFYGSFL